MYTHIRRMAPWRRHFSTVNTPPILIRGGTVVNHDKSIKADVFCKDGKIEHIADSIDDSAFEDARVIDATGKLVIPGGIDPHTHMEMPFMGTTAIDDYRYGTQAAVAGGTTTLLDFVMTGRGQSPLDAYKDWVGKAMPKITCDVGFHVALTWWGDQVSKEMEILTNDFGIQAYKFFLAYNGVLRLEDEPLIQAMKRCRELGALAQVHAENGDLIIDHQREVFEAGITGPEGHPLSRPESMEAEATNRAIEIADYASCPLYVVHCMSKSAARVILEAKAEGKLVFGETLAAALATDGSKYYDNDWRVAAGHVMSPPLREDVTTKYFLMNLVKSGVIDVVATDNCTFSTAQKAMGKDDFRLIPNGVNGIEDRLSIVWDRGVKQHYLTPNEFVQATSTAAAKIYNLYPQKGALHVGSDADIVVWDGEAKRTISAETHHHAVDFNIFEGMEVYGVADVTLSRGKVVWENGQLYAEDGWGNILSRPPYGHVYEKAGAHRAFKDPARFKVPREEYAGPVWKPNQD